ncbi:MAG: alpha/beta hydrolase [Chloroflexota bacterium]
MKNVQPASTTTLERRTHRLPRPQGVMVVDEWVARQPSGVDPIVLIHGWGGTGRYWHASAEKLAETARVIVPDLPGTGRSQPVANAQDMYDQVEALVFMLDALNLKRVQLVGHSMGGAMSLLLSADHPERVSRAVLTSLALFMTKEQEQLYSFVIKTFSLMIKVRPPWMTNVPGAAQFMAKEYFYRVPKDKQILRDGLEDYLSLDEGTAMACARNATDQAIKDAAKKVNMPMMLIIGREDKRTPNENADFTAETIGDCSVRWISACGHLPMVEKPHEYMRLLRGFLDL